MGALPGSAGMTPTAQIPVVDDVLDLGEVYLNMRHVNLSVLKLVHDWLLGSHGRAHLLIM